MVWRRRQGGPLRTDGDGVGTRRFAPRALRATRGKVDSDHLVTFQDTVDRCGRFPTDAQASTMAQSSEKLLVLYGGLARKAAES
eukprot:9401953-Pyramimonas_sp.AAC.1